MKRCRKCGEEKSPEAFEPKRWQCRSCISKQTMARDKANPERKRARDRKSREKNRDRTREKNASRQRKYYARHFGGSLEWRNANRERFRATRRAWAKDARARGLKFWRREHLKKYGLTPETFDAMLVSQGGGCKVCAGLPGGKGTFHVDHDHATGLVRGLLCHCCNLALGLVKDDATRLRRLAAYLENHSLTKAVRSA